jgi:hypothetical protein
MIGQELRGGVALNIKILTRQRPIREGVRLFALRDELPVGWNATLGSMGYPFSQAPPTQAGQDEPFGRRSAHRFGVM